MELAREGDHGPPAEELLLQAERMRAMANRHPALLWISDETGMCIEFNEAWLNFRGRTLAEESGVGWLSGVHPDDADQCMQTYLQHFQDREPFEMRYRLGRHDGRYRQILDAGAPWFHTSGDFAGFVGSCLDITDHVRVRQVLRETEELYRVTVEALHEGVIVADGDGLVLSMNPAAERMLGVPASWLLGRPLPALAERVPFLDAQGNAIPVHQRPSAVALRTGQPVIAATVGWSVAGSPVRWHEANARPLRSPGEDRIFALVTSFVDVTEHKTAVARAHDEARLDLLTGLVNRRGLGDRVRQMVRPALAPGLEVGIAFCDVDDFKVVNDTLGHDAGDQLLKVICERIVAAVRAADIVSRFGGDEIVVILDSVAGMPGALSAGEKIRAAVALPVQIGSITVTPTLSVGVATLRDVADLDSALAVADEAMYCAKRTGGNQVAGRVADRA